MLKPKKDADTATHKKPTNVETNDEQETDCQNFKN